MRLDLLFALIIAGLCAVWSVAMAAPRQKRQGLFICSGWGASCSSGWRISEPRKVKTQHFQQVIRKPPNRPRPTRTRFWLTTGEESEKAWGPMGKRSDIDNSYFLYALAHQLQDSSTS